VAVFTTYVLISCVKQDLPIPAPGLCGKFGWLRRAMPVWGGALKTRVPDPLYGASLSNEHDCDRESKEGNAIAQLLENHNLATRSHGRTGGM